MSLATLVTTAPDPTAGIPLGVGDWRIVPELLLPGVARSVVGTMRVGLDPITSDDWRDVSDWVSGIEIVDGPSDFGEHPQPSTCKLTLESDTAGRFIPWGPIGADGSGHRLRPGCPVRVSLLDPVGDVWAPLFTGEIETALPQSAGSGVARQVVVTAVDTVTSRLSKPQILEYQIDPGAVGVALDAVMSTAVTDLAAWPYGTVFDVPKDDAGDTYTTAGRTNLTGTLLEQLRRIGDTIGRQVSADRFGRLAVVRRRPQLLTYTNAHTPAADPNEPPAVVIDATLADPDTLVSTPTDEAIVNSYRIVDVIEPGIFGPATIAGPTPVVARANAMQNATISTGIRSSSSQVLAAAVPLFRYNTATAGPAGASVDRYGPRPVTITDMFPIRFGYFAAGYIAAAVVDQYADDLSRFDAVRVTGDTPAALDLIATAEVGSAFTVEHDAATWTGRVGAITFRILPLAANLSARITATFRLDAYTLERNTL